MTPSQLAKMFLAEERLKELSPATASRVAELKKKYSNLYKLTAERFDEVTHTALAANVRDGQCHTYKQMKEKLKLYFLEVDLAAKRLHN